jgi:hypothetical protein
MTTIITSTAAVKNNEPVRFVSPLCRCEQPGHACDFCEDEAFTVWKIERAVAHVDTQAVAELRAAAEADAPPEGPTADDLAELHGWAAETAAREHLDRSTLLDLAGLAEFQAQFFRGWGNGAGDLFGRVMEELSQKVRFVGAVTPEDFEAREQTIEQEAREQWEDVGYEQGKAAAKAECERRHGGRARNVFEGGPSED